MHLLLLKRAWLPQLAFPLRNLEAVLQKLQLPVDLQRDPQQVDLHKLQRLAFLLSALIYHRLQNYLQHLVDLHKLLIRE
jgi:hypothetical protein